jgi:hypothetical protein
MSLQLDLFLDSRSVVLANEAANALLARDAERSAKCVAELRALAPDHPNLECFEILSHALAEWRQPTSDVAEISLAIETVEFVLAPAARQALGPASALMLDALFRDLARASHGLPYDPTRARAYEAWLSLRCGDWAEAEAAALSIPRVAEVPDALHWLTVARYRQRGLAAARPTLFALAWYEPQRLAAVVGELADELLERDFRSFECACEWADIEANALAAWFPAWYVLEHPGASKDLDDLEPPARAPAKAAKLLVRIFELERRADWRALVALREQLRLLSSDLFSLYMAPRVVRYLG